MFSIDDYIAEVIFEMPAEEGFELLSNLYYYSKNDENNIEFGYSDPAMFSLLKRCVKNCNTKET